MTIGVEFVGVRLDVGGDLGLQRGREHLPCAVTGELIEQRPADSCRGVEVGLGLFGDYLEHGRTSPEPTRQRRL